MLTYTACKRTLTCLHLAIAGALLVAGCSSSSSPSLQQGCSDYTLIFRARQTTCHGIKPEPDQSALITRETQACVLDSGASGSQVDATYWEDCAASANNGCNGYQCAPYPPGTRKDGEPCLSAKQCASLWCKGTVVTGAGGTALSGATQCGTCASRLAPGAACNAVTDVCETGSSCFFGGCRPKGSQGTACVVWNDCEFPVVCRSNGGCDFVLPNGAPCGSGSDCGSDTGCDLTTKLCTPVQYAQPGAPCDGEVHRCESGRCNKATGVCAAVLADGAPCDPADPSKVCDVYAYCFEGKCQIPDPATCK